MSVGLEIEIEIERVEVEMKGLIPLLSTLRPNSHL
jgi:hypothetical protein